jgi:hypothetical protein
MAQFSLPLMSMVTLRVLLFAINVKFVAKMLQTSVTEWDG